MAELSTISVKNVPDEPRPASTWSRPGLAGIWIAGLLLAAFGRIIWNMGGSWFDDQADMAHGLFVPLAAAYMIWMKWDVLRRTPIQSSVWGVLIVFGGAILATFASAAQWIWVARMAFLISLVGCLAALYGFRLVRELAYPLATLVLMVAPPSFVYERVTLPLQLLASRLGELSLEALGYSVLREGNILEMVGERMAVEEACSGIRSLMTLFFLCVVYSYFFVHGSKMRLILLASVVPISILCNAGRILATGVMAQYDRELAHGALHPAFGHLSLLVAGILCLGLHRILVTVEKRWQGRNA